jgi:DNA-binding transcriptional MerR regulator
MTRPEPATLLFQTVDAARLAGVTQSAISRAAREGRFRVHARTAYGIRLFRRADIEQYRRARLARLARALRAAAEPRDGAQWDAEQSSALDLALATEERLGERGRR